MQASEQTEDKWRQGCYETCEECGKTHEECTCPCSACGGTGYVVTVSGGPFNVTGKRDCVVCNYEKSALKRGTEIHESWPDDRCEDCGEEQGECHCNGTTEEELNE